MFRFSTPSKSANERLPRGNLCALRSTCRSTIDHGSKLPAAVATYSFRIEPRYPHLLRYTWKHIMAQAATPPAIEYREIMTECQQLMQKIAELEVDRNEHQLVEETLKPLDGKRRAYRLVGEVLVERTVEEVLPSVATNKQNVRVKFPED